MTLRTVRILLWLPLVAFLIILALVASGLITPHDAAIRSQMVGRPLPAFDLASGRGDAGRLRSAGFRDGTPRLVNFFASWCVPCVGEAPQLLRSSRRACAIEGIAVRDRPADLAASCHATAIPMIASGSTTRRGCRWRWARRACRRPS